MHDSICTQESAGEVGGSERGVQCPRRRPSAGRRRSYPAASSFIHSSPLHPLPPAPSPFITLHPARQATLVAAASAPPAAATADASSANSTACERDMSMRSMSALPTLSWNTLYRDALQCILAFFTLRELACSAVAVSRRWRHAAEKMRGRGFTLPFKQETPLHLLFVSSLRHYVSALISRPPLYCQPLNVSPQLLASMTASMPHLESLDANFAGYSEQVALSLPAQLRQLTVRESSNGGPSSFLTTVCTSPCAQQLTELNLEEHWIWTAAVARRQRLVNLARFQSGWICLPDCAFLARMPQLTDLRLKCSERVLIPPLIAALAHCTRIQTLQLCHGDMSDAELTALLAQMPLLTDLTLLNMAAVTSLSVLSSSAALCQRLRRLQLFHGAAATTEQVREHVPRLVALTELTIKWKDVKLDELLQEQLTPGTAAARAFGLHEKMPHLVTATFKR